MYVGLKAKLLRGLSVDTKQTQQMTWRSFVELKNINLTEEVERVDSTPFMGLFKFWLLYMLITSNSKT